ncbi:hypothetical protein LTR10_013690 [Elasticomyces elasticus]|uniref:CobW C-terminal domain-containing protein n=1 Tax=Exophiala sideris TaxID=1016849 RepID=A0ABR0JGU1_9EURO|nr:hypothetical protein LTR10_013690 [Elasticomyces elasticus]KAK5033335.1 hypothetical protein LTS07_003637 [Exophiala sideris]KAK5042168.1 hypothetical protein LTR13_001974 [Exophiala sideris]KAK5063879.1 hypothetical protein LTR69_003645 [Exophiala sideris]KAK5185436.1 hypothetical protein LTR44_002425 [Eurotiomycetes sp. CCFEE 6388]
MAVITRQRAKSGPAPADREPIPVTLVSGFLGSGKTTLLRHILTSDKHNLRVAVIVNDMAALNIDAALIKRHVVSQTQERLIQMENGCICCTLRGDLLEELARLARNQECEAELGGLQKVAKLDTLITAVDAFNFFLNFATTDFITDRWGKEGVHPEDERTVTDLMVDQIEFANTIILNKADSVDKATKARIRAIIQQLNPAAKVFESNFSKVDVMEVIGTKSFTFEKAATSMGWLQSLHDLSKREINGQIKIAPKPETEEYGISSFVYRARRPFNPRRLYKLIHDKFVIMEGQMEDENQDEEDDNEDDAMEDVVDDAANPSSGSDRSATTPDVSAEEDDETDDTSISDVSEEDKQDENDDFAKSIEPKVVPENKKANPIFAGLLRSKGFFWLATRPSLHGEWSQAGTMLTLQGGGPWFCTLDDAHWPSDTDTRASILADFAEPWGDRRQEIVFIGEKLKADGLKAEFDGCLLTDREMQKWEKIMKSSDDMEVVDEKLADVFEDGFEDWPELVHDEEEGEHDHNHATQHPHQHQHPRKIVAK